MTPRQEAMLRDARARGSLQYEEDDKDMVELLEQGLLYDIGVGICEITAEGKRALRQLRE